MRRITLPSRALYEDEILSYLHDVPGFRGCFMRDELPSPQSTQNDESGILNLNSHELAGSHWCLWIIRNRQKHYFDSYAARPPLELIRYLKTPSEIARDEPIIKTNATICQHANTTECGALCIFFIVQMVICGKEFHSVIEQLHERYLKKVTPSLNIPYGGADPPRTTANRTK